MDESILYDRTSIPTDWDNDVSTAEVKSEIEVSVSAFSSITTRLSALLRYSGLSIQTGCNLPPKLVHIISQSNPWQISLSPCGGYMAILRRNHLELRSGQDNFATVNVTQITKDKHCEWRKIFWSGADWLMPEFGTTMAVSLSSGKVFLFDMNLSVIKRIDPEHVSTSMSLDYSCSVAACIFPEPKVKLRSGLRYCCIIYRNGHYSIYRIDAKTNILLVSSNVLNTPSGIEDYVWSHKHQLLVTAGGKCPGETIHSQKGLNGWKFQEEKGELRSLANIIKESDSNLYERIKTGVSMALDGSSINGSRLVSLSPTESQISLVDLDGTISVWELPNLVLKSDSSWKISCQPHSSEKPPDQKMARSLASHFNSNTHSLPYNVTWWTESTIAINRVSGCLSIHSVTDGGLSLVAETEWVSPGSCTTNAVNRSLFGIECQIKSSQSKDFFADDESDKSLIVKSFTFMKGILYFLTEIERLKPAAKAGEALTREYSLFQLEQTTPNLLYLRKIDDGEYGEALQVAHEFGLDTDLVYQRRWETSEFDQNAIEDFLRKITKRSYINEQVLNRIPERLDNCRELLKFGLKGNDLPVLADLTTENPENLGYILDEDNDDDEEEYRLGNF